MKFLVLIAAFLFAESVLAESPQEANFEEIFGKVQTAWTKFGTDIQEFFNANLPSQDEIAKNIKSQSEIFVQKAEAFSKKLEEEAKKTSGDAKKNLDLSITKINEAITKLKDSSPGVTNKIQELSGNLQNAAKEIGEEFKKIGENLSTNTEDINTHISSMVKDGLKKTQEFADKAAAELKKSLEKKE